ncbi:MAG: ATP-binding protein [Melioribacteraceae bacterium]
MPLKKASKLTELKPEELSWVCDPEIFKFETTSHLKPIEGIVGQERALKALKLGVELKSPGYNIFVTGLSGTGKFTSIKSVLESISPDCSQLKDYAYVNNFKDRDRPTLLEFPAGKAVEFKEALYKAIKFLQEKIPSFLSNDPFVSQKKKLLEEFGSSQSAIMNEFEEKLKKDNFTLGQVKVGELTRPEILAVIENEPVFMQQLGEFVKGEKITKEQADQFIKKYSSYQEELAKVFKQSLKLSQSFQEKILELEKSFVGNVIHITMDEIKKQYQSEKIINYLEEVEDDILSNLEIFKGQKPATEETQDGLVVDYLKEYEINIILDNTGVKSCPVVLETSPTYNNIFGTIEKFSDGRGGWYADFTKVKAGALLRANGGFLILNALDSFSENGVWKALKRVLLYGKLEIQDLASMYQFSPSVLKPEPIDIECKIILVGNNYIYSVLSNYGDDFNKIFKVKADFDYEIERNEQSIFEYARLIKKLIEQEKLLEFDKTAVARITEYGAKYSGRQNKLTTRFAYIADLVRESNFWAKDNGDKTVSNYHVDQAFLAKRERHGLYESKVQEMLDNKTLLIETTGKKIGMINGLAVYGGDAYSFGKPTRITASVSLGNGTFINVERESGLSGSSHNKGVLIISGYFKEKFGRKLNLAFNANIVFEQGYGMIDGDSASITEICVISSALSRLPIKQSIAITGSVNQKGEIQPIGGVNEKVEGYFDVCSKRGLDGSHGVIIPIQNVKDLMLKQEVIDAVKENKFHIFPVAKVEEAIEILFSVEAGTANAHGDYPVGTVFGEVEKELKEMRKTAKGEHEKKPHAHHPGDKDKVKPAPKKKRIPKPTPKKKPGPKPVPNPIPKSEKKSVKKPVPRPNSKSVSNRDSKAIPVSKTSIKSNREASSKAIPVSKGKKSSVPVSKKVVKAPEKVRVQKPSSNPQSKNIKGRK